VAKILIVKFKLCASDFNRKLRLNQPKRVDTSRFPYQWIPQVRQQSIPYTKCS